MKPRIRTACSIVIQTQSGIPWRTQFKLVGTYPLPWGIQLADRSEHPGASTRDRGAGRHVRECGDDRADAWRGRGLADHADNQVRGGLPGACTPGALVDPGMTVASLSVPLLRPARCSRIASTTSTSPWPAGSRFPARGFVCNRRPRSSTAQPIA